MLTIFLRGLIIFGLLLVVIRLMGKRQIGEMEPFELVITLVISEIACVPMGDKNIPLTYGVVCILTLYIVHQVIVLLSKNTKMQSIISGKPMLVIDKSGINVAAVKQLNMQVNDLMQSLRNTGYFSVEEIEYALMETNGQLSVIPKKSMENKQKSLPVPLILEGKWCEDELTQHGIDREKIGNMLFKKRVKVKDVVFLTVDQNDHFVLQDKQGVSSWDAQKEGVIK
ncbi:MAG: DUF421 domain-containing protein [Christensenellales bacterium]|nr:DUF421 domain-containing protein [Clostridiales bacterium]MDY5726067.1 DUF421 domain-containing protein [Eubacteriales bacterium]